MLNEVVFQRPLQEIMAKRFFISILRGETEEEISDKVLDLKKSMVNQDVKILQRILPKVKNLTKYIPKGKRQLFQWVKVLLLMLKKSLLQ